MPRRWLALSYILTQDLVALGRFVSAKIEQHNGGTSTMVYLPPYLCVCVSLYTSVVENMLLVGGNYYGAHNAGKQLLTLNTHVVANIEAQSVGAAPKSQRDDGAVGSRRAGDTALNKYDFFLKLFLSV